MWLHILGLWTLAVVQPVLGPLARSPEFFVAHRAGRGEILLLVLVVQLALPGLLIAAVWLAGRGGPRVRTAVAGTVLVLLLASLALQALKLAGVGSWHIAVPVALAGGLAATLAYWRFDELRRFASLLSAGALIAVPLLFLAAPGMRSLLGIGGGSASAGGTAAPASARAHSTPVVLIVFDELPVASLMNGQGQIDPVLYPHLAALAGQGVWYRNTTTVSDFTRWALPAILSGRYPEPDAIPTPADHPDTLFTLLAPTHRLDVVEAVTDLCPRALCNRPDVAPGERVVRMASDLWLVYQHVLATEDLKRHLPELTGDWADLGAEGGDQGDLGERAPSWARRWRRARIRDKVQDARDVIDRITRDAPQPAFHFMHTLVSHHPYAMLPDGRRSLTRVPIPGRARESWTHDEWAVSQHYQQHLLQVGFVDTLVGRLVDRLRAADLYESALIVITSDHGIAFKPGQPLREFRETNAADIMRVPLIVKYPDGTGPAGVVSDRFAETVDILPTVADVLELPVGWPADGRSLLDDTAPERRVRTLYFDYATRSRTFGPGEPDVAPLVDRMRSLFGGPENTARSPAPPAFGGLVGQEVSALHVRDSDERIDVNSPWEFDEMSRDPVPFEVSGRVPQSLRDGGEAYVGVAVNGVVRAVTRTWDGRGEWMATPPLEAWRAAGNDLEVFILERQNGRTELQPVFRQRPRPADLNLVSGVAAQEFGVRQHGFYPHEMTSSGPFRWTNGRAVLQTTIPEHRRPRSLHVSLAMTGRGGKQLTVSAGHCVLFDGRVEGSWQADLPLAPCGATGEVLQITLAGDAAAPNSRDRRRLGVGVREVRLDW